MKSLKYYKVCNIYNNMQKTEYLKKMYQKSVQEKQMMLRTNSIITNTAPPQIPSNNPSKKNGFLSRLFLQKEDFNQAQDRTTSELQTEKQFTFAYFDRFTSQISNISGENQTLQEFKKLIMKYKTHELKQIKIICVPKSGEKISFSFKQKIYMVLSKFFPYEIVFDQKEYQMTLTNKVQAFSKKYKGFVNLSSARTFTESKNKNPSYQLLIQNTFEDLNGVHRQFDEIILGLIDGVFDNKRSIAKKIKCITFAEEKIGTVSMDRWRNSSCFINIISECIHQMLHILQFDHCFKRKCLMNLRPNNAGLSLCSSCLQKFYALFEVDFKMWFKQVSDVLKIVEQNDQHQKFNQIHQGLRLQKIDF